jgi:hypothetical protein
MIHLRFEGMSQQDSITLGPAPWYRIDGPFIRVGPHGGIAATFTRHQWEVRGTYFGRYDCIGSCRVQFEGAGGGITPHLGPYARFNAAGCVPIRRRRPLRDVR